MSQERMTYNEAFVILFVIGMSALPMGYALHDLLNQGPDDAYEGEPGSGGAYNVSFERPGIIERGYEGPDSRACSDTERVPCERNGGILWED